MARFYPTITMLLFCAAALLTPAQAQFGSIFGPPRPPADIPDGAAPPPNFPTSRDRTQDFNRDRPPDEPLPAPMTLPPGQRPGASIQTAPLAPPPGAQQQPPPPMREATPQPAQTLPGLPPGQRQPRGVPQQQQPAAITPQQQQPATVTPQQQPAAIEPPPNDEVALAPPEHRLENPTAVFSGLDKITGRTITFDVAINETVQFGALQVTPRACYSRPPTETPRTDAFVAVDEVTLQGEVRRIFTGWMFASSPGLHAVEHPIYDVWLTDCKGAAQPAVAQAPDEAAKPIPQPRRRSNTHAPQR
jgi:hypothetical protein